MVGQIKFRGRTVDSMEWVNGYYAVLNQPGYESRKGHYIIYFDGKAQISKLVDPETVGQYAGLKDKNGVEIYEGDILQRPLTINSDYHGDWIRDEVIYKPGVFFTSHIASEKGQLPRGYTAGELLSTYFDYDGKLFAFSEDYEPRCLGEVIGNTYENPELLKAGEASV